MAAREFGHGGLIAHLAGAHHRRGGSLHGNLSNALLLDWAPGCAMVLERRSIRQDCAGLRVAASLSMAAPK